MRVIFPRDSELTDLYAAYALPELEGRRRSFVRCNMISTYDGAIALDGRSGTLGGPADRRVFQVLRSWADVILVGAGTVRIEGYGPARLDHDVQVVRRRRGQSSTPQIAIVTGSGNLEWSSSLFTDSELPPLIVTTNRFDRTSIGAKARVAGVIQAGDDRVDIETAIDQLFLTGYRSVLLEGGPGLNADVVHAGLLDELCLTVSPRLIGGNGPRIFAGNQLDPPIELDVAQVIEEGGYFFYRLAVRDPDRRG
jgi:riboflavin biosynthesis pyrimidine reductase